MVHRCRFGSSLICLLLLLGGACSDDGGAASDTGVAADADASDASPEPDVGPDVDVSEVGQPDAIPDTTPDAGAPPVAYSVTPGWGLVEGGTKVTLRGEGFEPGMQVHLGTEDVGHLNVVDSQTAEFITPPALYGVADVAPVEIELDDRTSTGLTFHYVHVNQVEGGPIDGELTVTVISDYTRPIEGAYVKLAGTTFAGFTDADGVAKFTGPDIKGPHTVVATAAGHSSTMIQDAESDEVTVVLHEPDSDGAPPPPPTATIEGTVSGMDQLPEPGPTEFRVATVRTSIACATCSNPNPGSANTVMADGSFSLTSRTGELAVYVLAGLYDNETETFTAHRMGIARGLYVEGDQSYEVDLALDIPLVATPIVNLIDAPLSAFAQPQTSLRAMLDLGWEGYASLGTTAGTGDALNSPGLGALNNELSDAAFFFSGTVNGGDRAPENVVYLHDITYTGAPISSPPMLAISRLDLEQGAPLVPGDVISMTFEGTNRPDFFQLRITDSSGRPVWDILLDGSSSSVQLPSLPAFNSLPEDERPNPYPEGTFYLRVFGRDVSAFDWADFAMSPELFSFESQLGYCYDVEAIQFGAQ